jgi:hypothetical protein
MDNRRPHTEDEDECRLRIRAYFEMEGVGLCYNVRAELYVNVILLFVWMNNSRHHKTSNQIFHPSPMTYKRDTYTLEF